MERINSILSLVSRSGAKLGVLKHTTSAKSFNSVACGGHHHPSSRDIKGGEKIVWVLMDGKSNSGEAPEFPWEREGDHRELEGNTGHSLNIDFGMHGDLNHLMEEKHKNRYLSADWKTEGHTSHWRLSVLWDGNRENKLETGE